ncbi:MAG: YdbH domain-containing protein [Proteobacteria bacterium]|nr:YdbH domain-containing protein [Pseudomonadota bacterium]
MRRLIITVITAVALLIGTGWLLSPVLLEWLLTRIALEQGVSLAVRVDRPGIGSLRVTEATAHLPGYVVSLQGAHARYNLDSLLEQRLLSLEMAQLRIEIIDASSGADTPGDTPSPWMLVPAARLEVHHLQLQVPQARISGSLMMNPDIASADLVIESLTWPVTVDLQASLDPTGLVSLKAGLPGAVESITVTGNPDQGRIRLDGDIAASGEVFALATQLLLQQTLTGNLTGDFSLLLDWPIEPATLLATACADGNLQFLVAGDLDLGDGHLLDQATVNGSMALTLTDGLFDITATAIDIRARSLAVGSNEWQLEAGSGIVADMTAQLPVTDPDLSTMSEQGQTRANLVLDLGMPGTVTLDDTLILNQPLIKGPVELSMSSGLVSMTSSGLQVFATDLTYNGTKYSLDPDSRLVFQFEAGMDLPISTDVFPPVTASVRSDLDLTVSWDEDMPGRKSLGLSGLATTVLTGPRARTTVSDGLQLELGFAENAFSVRGRNAFTVDLDMESFSLSARELELVANTGSFNWQDNQLNFRAARIDVTTMTVAGDSLALTGKVRADSSTRAMPVNLNLQADLSSGTVDYQIAIKHQVARALLKNELPGWKSSYDLAAGELDLSLSGTFQPAGAETDSKLAGAGSLELKQGVAYHDDLVAADITAAFDILVDSESVQISSPDVQVGSVDVGFPVIDMGFGITTDLAIFRRIPLQVRPLGGRFSIDQLDYASETGESEFNVIVEALPLSNLLALEGEDISADGTLDGIIPLTLSNDQPRVTLARLTARPPGGRISYRSSVPAVNPQQALGLGALQDFRYSLLTADFDYRPDGTLASRVRLEGRSPLVENGRPIHFNLKVSENIPVLLESLRTAQTVEERVQQLLSR